MFRVSKILSLPANLSESELQHHVSKSNNKFIEELYRYELFIENFISSLNYKNYCEEYTEQLNYYRKVRNTEFCKLLQFSVSPNHKVAFFKTNYKLLYLLGMDSLSFNLREFNMSDLRKKTDKEYFIGIRKSFVDELGYTEFPVLGINNMLLDLFELNGKVKIHDFYEILYENIGSDAKMVLMNFLDVNIVNYYTLILN